MSALHRLPAGVKLLALAALAPALLAGPAWSGAGALATVLAGFAAAGLPARAAADALRPALPFAALAFTLAALGGAPAAGLASATAIAALMLAAALVTLTTREADIRAAFTVAARPLRPLGLSPRLVGLTLALALRFAPLTAARHAAIADAARARGARWPGLAALGPLVIGVLKDASHLADAIAVRGFDDRE